MAFFGQAELARFELAFLTGLLLALQEVLTDIFVLDE
jgi:hypothetical protein